MRMSIKSAGHGAFAATMAGIGILGLMKGNFAPVWEPVPKSVPAREALAYLCAMVSLASGLGLIVARTAALAARVLLVSLLAWLLLFRVPLILHAPTVEGSYQNSGETAVIVAGAWVLYATLAAPWDRRHLGFATGAAGAGIARVLYGLSMIAFGLSHFVYLKETASLVPGWLPAPVGFAYFTGAAYLAAGVAVLASVCARLAAALSAVQMGLFTLLVWLPIVSAGATPFQWSETVLSWALTAAAWAVTDSYHDTAWLALRPRRRPAG